MLISGLGRRSFRTTTILLVLKLVKTLHPHLLIQAVVKTAIETDVDANTAIAVTTVLPTVKVKSTPTPLAMQELS